MSHTGFMATWDIIVNNASAIIAAIASTTAVVLTVITQRKVGSWQKQVALTVADRQIDNQKSLAREERHQKRLEGAYKELLAWLHEVNLWARRVSRACDQRQPITDAAPEMPSHDHTVYWSERVLQLVASVNHLSVLLHHYSETPVSDEEWHREFAQDSAIITVLGSRILQIGQQARLELLGRHDGQGDEGWDAISFDRQTKKEVDQLYERQVRVHEEAKAIRKHNEYHLNPSPPQNNSAPLSTPPDQQSSASGGGTSTPA